MSKSGIAICETLPERPIEHPAVEAWSRLEPARVEPDAIERLKLKGKSAVYRLRGVGPDGSAVIAKRCATSTARIERTIYEECLAGLPIPSLRVYGLWEDTSNSASCWIFLEDAGVREYSREDAEHRKAAGHCLGIVHASCIEGLAPRLPDRGTGHYLRLLHESRATLVRYLVSRVLSAEEIATLHAVVAQLYLVESHWPEVEQVCKTVPYSLVHDDLVAKNVRLQATQTGFFLLVFDWENSGWGVPVADLCQYTGRSTVSPDLDAYGASLAERGRRVEPGLLRLWAQCGSIFRVLDNLTWYTSMMVCDSYRHLAKPVAHVRSYERQMAEALRPMGWKA